MNSTQLPLKTPQLARQENMSYQQVLWLIRSRRIPEPQRDSSHHYVWTQEDVERVRAARRAMGKEIITTGGIA